jgi:hypothetical protein
MGQSITNRVEDLEHRLGLSGEDRADPVTMLMGLAMGDPLIAPLYVRFVQVTGRARDALRERYPEGGYAPTAAYQQELALLITGDADFVAVWPILCRRVREKAEAQGLAAADLLQWMQDVWRLCEARRSGRRP